jgi:hypothetical protein
VGFKASLCHAVGFNVPGRGVKGRFTLLGYPSRDKVFL